MISTARDSFFICGMVILRRIEIIQAFAVLAKKTRCFQGFQVVMDRVSSGIKMPGNLRNTKGFSGIFAEKLLDLNPEIVLALHGEINAKRTL